jgi:predicted GIY-YIG superfamily endonuclease
MRVYNINVSSYSFVFMTSSGDRRPQVGVTKDVELEREMLRLRSPESEARIVLVERSPSHKAALARAQQLKRMNHARRQKLVERVNPTWLEVDEFCQPWVPALTEIHQRLRRRFGHLLDAYRPGPRWPKRDDDHGAAGGVTANLPTKPPPRADSYRHPFPDPKTDGDG